MPRGVTEADAVVFGPFDLQLRAAGENEILLAGRYHNGNESTGQKYAVTLKHPPRVRRITDAEWDSGGKLRLGDGCIPPEDLETGIRYQGRVFQRSGTAWKGKGVSPPPCSPLSPGKTHVAVASWDGIAQQYGIFDLDAGFKRSNVHGKYWLDIYETGSGRALMRIEGAFRGSIPDNLFWRYWFSDRYFVMPIGHTSWAGSLPLSHLLICDMNAAAGGDGTRSKKRK